MVYRRFVRMRGLGCQRIAGSTLARLIDANAPAFNRIFDTIDRTNTRHDVIPAPAQ